MCPFYNFWLYRVLDVRRCCCVAAVAPLLLRRCYDEALSCSSSARSPEFSPSTITPCDITFSLSFSSFELRQFLCRIVLRRVTDQFARVGNIETFETVVAQAVQNGELQVFDIYRAHDGLMQIAV